MVSTSLEFQKEKRPAKGRLARGTTFVLPDCSDHSMRVNGQSPDSALHRISSKAIFIRIPAADFHQISAL
jgi:hypothetical protein